MYRMVQDDITITKRLNLIDRLETLSIPPTHLKRRSRFLPKLQLLCEPRRQLWSGAVSACRRKRVNHVAARIAEQFVVQHSSQHWQRRFTAVFQSDKSLISGRVNRILRKRLQS